MKKILNKTAGPLRVPLSGGKVLHLGPRMAAQVSDRATELPAVKKLVDDGSIEIVGDGERPRSGDASHPGAEDTRGRGKSQHRSGHGDR